MSPVEPTPRDRWTLRAWCGATFFPTVALLLYLPMSTQPGAEALSESPTPLTLFFGICALGSVGLALATRRRPAFFAIRGAMTLGAMAALIGVGLYGTYVYSFSQTLPESDAPQEGSKAPLFSVSTPEGRTLNLESFRGGPVLLLFYRGNW